MPRAIGGRPAVDHRPAFAALLLVAMLLAGMSANASAAIALPPCTVADTLTRHRWLTDWNRSLLDITYRLSSAYVPPDLRSTTAAGLNSGYSVRSFVIADLKAMASAARAAGRRFVVTSAYRSYKTQKATFDYWVRVHGYTVALKESARAGHSEHQLGTTLDFRAYGGAEPWDYRDWGATLVGKWLGANAWKYGFVMSYPKYKTAVTCYQYEPWHFRYVGKARAAQIRATGLTLRQFLWLEQNGALPTPTPTPTPSPTPTPTPSPTPTPTPT
jgi:D-alanyl-D-alanine carboxypeptidase